MADPRGSAPQPASARGEVCVEYRSPMLLRTRLVARHFDVRLAGQFIATVDEWMAARTSLVALHDCALLDDYDVEARELVTAWARGHIGQFDVVHLLVQGRAVAWGLRLISAVVGAKLVTHHDRGSFEAAGERGRPSGVAARP